MPQDKTASGVNRREVLQGLSSVMAAVSTTAFFGGLTAEQLLAQGQSLHARVARGAALAAGGAKGNFFTSQQLDTVAVLSDLIIPETDSPGARQANVHAFLDGLMASRPEGEQKRFLEGLEDLEKRSRGLYQKNFREAAQEQQVELLAKLEQEESEAPRPADLASTFGFGGGGPNGGFFQQVKSYTVFGYYTSAVGLKELGWQAMGYGIYEGCTHPEHQG